MASGALPPGLPPVEIDGEFYWDGGLVSNTPLEYVLDEPNDRDLLIFQVDLFPARGPMPETLVEAAEREMDIRYSSRTRLNTDQAMRIHRAKCLMRRLIESLPPELADTPTARVLAEMSVEHAVTIVQLIYRRKAYESHSKDYEFSRATMLEHWSSGLEAVDRALAKREAMLKPGPGISFQTFDEDEHVVANGSPTAKTKEQA
jgi:NTE family protein